MHLPIDEAILSVLRPYRQGLPTSALADFLPMPGKRPRYRLRHVQSRLRRLEAEGHVRRDERQWWYVRREGEGRRP